MQALKQTDLWPLPVYEGVREQFRREVITAKKDRRIGVGPFMTLVFENRLTVKFQVQEILRAEKITDPVHVQEELDGFNAMLPDTGSLSATLMIELTGPEAEVAEKLTGLTGLGKHVRLEVGGLVSPAEFEGGREDGRRISAVQYVRFPAPRPSRRRSRRAPSRRRWCSTTRTTPIASPSPRGCADRSRRTCRGRTRWRALRPQRARAPPRRAPLPPARGPCVRAGAARPCP